MNTTAIILLVYLAVMFLIAWYFSRKEKLEAYFLNKRKTSLLMMTCSNVATLIGAGATVAIVSEVYNSGISYGIALSASIIVGGLTLAIIAKHIRAYGKEHNIYTLVDFFHKRFDMKNKLLVGILQMFLLVVWIAVQAVAIASLASVLVGINYHLALILAAGITILYTTIGGLKIDIITDFIQFWVIMIVFIIMFFFANSSIGGMSNLLASVPKGHLDIFNFAGISWFLGAMLLSGFIYMGNTIHWQRILSAESQKTARNSFLWSIPIIFIFGLLVVFLGLATAVLLPGISQDTAIFSLMDNILPTYLIGIGFAAILAVIMSSVDSLLVGGSTIIYRAVFKKEQFDNKREMFYARLITALFGICGFVLALIVPDIVALSLLVAYLALIFVPAIFAGIYSKKTSNNASFYSILIPFLILVITIPFLGTNSFILPVLTSILIVLFYDKVFKKKNTLVP